MKVLIFIVMIFLSQMPNLFGVSPAPESRPKLVMLDAIKFATEYAKDKIEIKDYYLDRVWVAIPPGDDTRKWIVSWSPNGLDPDNMKRLGWFIVIVDMDGNVSIPKKGVHWYSESRKKQ